MLVSRLSDVPAVSERAVIINVHTPEVATLAILSTLRYARMPVLLVDCEPTKDGFDWFTELMKAYPFDLVQAPIRKHGETLDVLFREIRCDQLLLVDSDVEILNETLLLKMKEAMKSGGGVFGSGYLHPAQWLDHHWDTSHPIASGIGYYVTRPWIPFTLLRVSHVRDALTAGCSFMHKLVRNDIPQSSFLSHLLWLRFQIPSLRNWKLHWLDPLRRTFDGHKPSYVHYDTGAEIYEHLRAKGLNFVAVSSAAEVPWSVRHLGGATRTGLHGENYDSVPAGGAADFARKRLWSEYGFAMGETGS